MSEMRRVTIHKSASAKATAKYRFKSHVTEGISHPVFYGDLVLQTEGGSDVKRISSRRALK